MQTVLAIVAEVFAGVVTPALSPSAVGTQKIVMKIWSPVTLSCLTLERRCRGILKQVALCPFGLMQFPRQMSLKIVRRGGRATTKLFHGPRPPTTVPVRRAKPLLQD